MSTKPIILTEGEQDDAFFRNLILVRKLKEFEIKERKGAPAGSGAFVHRLTGLKLETGLDRCPLVLLVADNDDDPAASFRLVAEQLRQAGWGVPTKSLDVVPSPDPLPPVAVLMLPWEDELGCLETICYTSASEKRPEIADCVEKFSKCVKAMKWPGPQLAKLKLRCLMSGASPKDPNTGLQYAWKASDKRPPDLIPLDNVCFNRVADYLASLPRTPRKI